MAVNLTLFPNLLFLTPVLTQVGRTIRDDLPQDQLKKCEAAAKEYRNIVSSISIAKRYGMTPLVFWMEVFFDDKREELSSFIKTQCTTRTEPIPQNGGTSAFWATTPFQIMGATQQFGYWIEETDHQLAHGFDSASTQIFGAAAFLGLAAVAVLRYAAYRDTSLLQSLIPAL